MKSLNVWVRTFANAKTGQKFAKASVLGKFLPKGDVRHKNPIDEEAFYTVKLVGSDFPVGKDGLYRVYFGDDGEVKAGAWVDERDGVDHVIRVKGKIVLEFQNR